MPPATGWFADKSGGGGNNDVKKNGSCRPNKGGTNGPTVEPSLSRRAPTERTERNSIDAENALMDAVRSTFSTSRTRSTKRSVIEDDTKQYSAVPLREAFEARELNFAAMAELYSPGKAWNDLSNSEKVACIRQELKPQHFLFDPHSEYMKYWDVVIAMALLFTGIVTPYEVIFQKTNTEITALFVVNRMVDLVFIKDMIMQFFLKVSMKRPGKRGTVIIRDPKKIRKLYLRTWFPIDFISVLPFDIWLMTFESSKSISGIKILRMLRLMRLVKLIRILKTSRLILRWQNYLAISFSTQKLCKFSFILMMCSHWMACFWGLVGLTWGKELCDADGNPLQLEGDIPVEEVSWVTTLFTGGKHSPDDPCVPMHVYTAALHWSVMTITSIGYGDIVPVRNIEYWAGILSMLTGGICWAYIIGSACGIISNLDPVQEAFEQNTDLLNTMMLEAAVPTNKRQQYREYLREAKVFDTMEQFRDLSRRFSPLLKGDLLLQLSDKWVQSVFYLVEAPERMIMDIADDFDLSFYSRKEQLHGHENCLCVIERGTLANAGYILSPGSAFNQDFIVSNEFLRLYRPVISLTYSLVLQLEKKKFMDILEMYPSYKSDIRKAATTIALRRVVILCAQKAIVQNRKSQTGAETGPAEWPTLADMFSQWSSEILALGLREDRESQQGFDTEAMGTGKSQPLSRSTAEDMNGRGRKEAKTREAERLVRSSISMAHIKPSTLDQIQRIEALEASVKAMSMHASAQLLAAEKQMQELQAIRTSIESAALEDIDPSPAAKEEEFQI